MTERATSVIIVSRGRPKALKRCLLGIEQLDYPAFEVVVVADPAGLAAVSEAGFDGRVKALGFDEPNISAARNTGIEEASGEILAFIDDDAVPEPTWLAHLTAPFADGNVVMAGGYVRGRNGISFQNTARSVNGLGVHKGLPVADDRPVLISMAPGEAVKTEGTNCAFRADSLRGIGGFDPVFRFYLDETDVNLRLAALGHTAAIVPLAEVHHGFAASERRLASRMPTTLFEIGASQAAFLRKHAQAKLKAGLNRIQDEQRQRLLRFMVAGLCDPRDVQRLMQDLENGIGEGLKRELEKRQPLAQGTRPFLRFRPRIRFATQSYLTGTWSQRNALRHEAPQRVQSGARVSLFLFDFSASRHRVRFTDAGYWEQKGGVFGKSERIAGMPSWQSFDERAKREIERVGKVRDCAKKHGRLE